MVLSVPLPKDDGIEFALDTATSEIIREEDEYPGVRVSLYASVAKSRNKFHVDVNVGDPIVPAPTMVSVPRLMGGEPIEVRGYPLHMVHAEKNVTVIQRGVANTPWRDFGDIWTLSRRHPLLGSDLQGAIQEVARYRNAELIALSDVLDGYAPLAQASWAAWRKKQNRDELPDEFSDLLAEMIAFAEPAITDDLSDMGWNPDSRVWASGHAD